jgi:hypothetical protein
LVGQFVEFLVPAAVPLEREYLEDLVDPCDLDAEAADAGDVFETWASAGEVDVEPLGAGVAREVFFADYLANLAVFRQKA